MGVAGVDGCRGGWTVAVVDGGRITVSVVPRLAEVLDLGCLAVAVDIPMGLADASPRACDVAARRLAGPRRASVFPAPVRAVLGARDHPDAVARSRRACGRGLSVQAWNLVSKVAEADAVLDPFRQATVVEAHPEVSFALLAGAPMRHPKRTAAGRAERVAALAAAALAPPEVPAGAAPDDVLDAAVLAWTAARWAAGAAVVLGDGARDRRGLVMRVVA